MSDRRASISVTNIGFRLAPCSERSHAPGPPLAGNFALRGCRQLALSPAGTGCQRALCVAEAFWSEERRTEPASQLLAPWACMSRTRKAQTLLPEVSPKSISLVSQAATCMYLADVGRRRFCIVCIAAHPQRRRGPSSSAGDLRAVHAQVGRTWHQTALGRAPWFQTISISGSSDRGVPSSGTTRSRQSGWRLRR